VAAAARVCPDSGFVVDISSPAGSRAVFFSCAARTGSEMAREAWRLVKAGTAALSFGYMVTDSLTRSGGIEELREIDLYEISLTPTPANPEHPHPQLQVDRPTRVGA
jgi:phage head maturation protease